MPPEPWPDLAGRLIPGGHVLPVRIYFEDTDFSGVVYHGSYIRFMERGRSDFVRLLGVAHTALDAGDHGEPLVFAVHRINIGYFKPARIDDLVEVTTLVKAVTGARLILNQTVTRDGAETDLRTKGRHDPCVALRGVPVVEAMAACVLADAMLRHRAQMG